MRKAFVVITMTSVALASGTLFGQRGPAAPPLVRENATEKVSDHVYVIPDNSVAVVPNVGIIVGTRATMVIDTGLGARNGETIMREVGKVSRNAELYLVTTHFHPEHDLGANGFPTHTKMIRSEDQLADIKEFGLAQVPRFSAMSPLHAELLKGAEFRKADITFTREHTVDLGDVRVRILAMGANHTRGDTAMYVQPDGVLFSGDVVMTALPGLGSPLSTIKQWRSSLQRFEQLQPRIIVPSHGPVGGAAMITAYQTFFQTVQTRAAELKKQGRSLEETEKALTSELSAQYPGGRLAGAIRAAYNEAN